uniref:Tyrosyl-DNA phosphodiesterase n=1 Tax=Clastoptera arizonana TaxID=38151 RepID=A0A1B6DYN1_9HEMI
MESEQISALPKDYQTEVDLNTVNEQIKLLSKIKGMNLKVDNVGEKAVNSLDNRDNNSDSNSSREQNQKITNHNATNKSEDKNFYSTEDVRINSMSNSKVALAYFEKVKSKSKGKIVDKLKAAAPYNFFLTSIAASKPTHTEQLSLQLFDILDPSLGDLESSLQINFMVEYGFLMAQYHIAGQREKPMTVFYGECDNNKWHPHITAVKIKPPSPFGSHHTKMSIMSYTDGSVRIAVTTANLVEEDWENRTQGVWLSPICPVLPLEHDTMAGDSPTGFKKDLVQYLSAYQKPELTNWIHKVKKADCSSINVFFVASTPGTHKGTDYNNWGQGKLASVLRAHCTIPKDAADWSVIAQFSSIGTLGAQPSDWLCGELRTTMSNGCGTQLLNPPTMKLIYPSISNVENSHDGLLGGGCLPYSKRVDDKQPWLKNYLYQWKSEGRFRTKAVPHIKTYTRVSPENKHIAWFLLTSANLSKAAWGKRNTTGGLGILSYEAGVLFIPKFINGGYTFPVTKEVDSKDIPVFPLPYDLPLLPYSSRDKPFLIDILC